MKVVALVSGGKDSCYAMMRCMDYGHQIVALANLLPLEDSVDELDSYMYQTVGHQIISKYAECMGLPLFRRRIQGKSRHQELKYKRTEGDEVEDLMILLKEVKNQIPEVEGVSSGAIASDYQRLRVESVCSRLGLVSLAFLWKQDQDTLLQEMISRGIEAILVKVAVIGLHPNKHLGLNLSAIQPYLLHLKGLYGINTCGEGGEYETLTLDCPLFKTARIVIDRYDIVLHSPDSFAPVGILHPLAFHLEPKKGRLLSVMDHDGLDKNTSIICPIIEVKGNNMDAASKFDSLPPRMLPEADCSHLGNVTCIRNGNGMLTINSWLQPDLDFRKGFKSNFNTILKGVEHKLLQYNLVWEDVLYIHLYLADMEQFSIANDIYMKYIKEENCTHGVPSRSTVEIPTEGIFGSVYVEVLVSEDKSKKVLHVQSISCWAPSCIGPYSQATVHMSILYMAGQLGLDPPSMTLISQNANIQAHQALVNCEAVANAFGCSLLSSTLTLTVYCSIKLSSEERQEINNTVGNFLTKVRGSPNSTMTLKESESFQPIIEYILVSSLPKRALIEIKPILCLPCHKRDGTEDEIETTPLYAQMAFKEYRYSGDKQIASLHCESRKIDKHLCASIVMVAIKASKEIGSKVPDSASEDLLLEQRKEFVDDIARSCIALLTESLGNSNLVWENVVILRVYFNVHVVPIDVLMLAFKKCVKFHEHSREDFQAQDASFGPFMPNFIPVHGSGRDVAMSDMITCELFASCL